MQGVTSRITCLLCRNARQLTTAWNPSCIKPAEHKPRVAGQQASHSIDQNNGCKRHFSMTTCQSSIFSSPLPDINIKEETLMEYLFPQLDSYGNIPALVDYTTGKSYSYAELKQAIINVASALSKLGYKKGDVIAIFSANCPEYCIFFLACAASGIIVTSANPAYTSGELSRHLIHSGSSAVIAYQPLVGVTKDAINSDEALKSAIKEVFVIGAADGCRPFSTLIEDDGKTFPENVDIDPVKDVVVMPYSSGTTGLPKGVMLTHMNLVSNIQQFVPLLSVTPADTSLAVLPLYHIYGMVPIMMGVLQGGAKLVTLPRFDPEMFLKSIMEYKVTHLHIVPPIVVFMAKHPIVSKFDLSSLQRTISGAAPLMDTLTNEYTSRINTPITQGYGLTETSPVLTLDKLPSHYGSTGVLVPNTKAKIVCTETGRELGVGETGELLFAGPQVMKGYLNNDQATNNTVIDGWFHSGDIGHVSEEGYFYVTDRLKELIKYKGFQVPPAELESLLLEHPSVQDAAVIGVPDADAGELPKAYVVLKQDHSVSSEDIQKFVEENASPYKKLRGGVEFTKEIPKSPAGKILRRLLRDQS